MILVRDVFQLKYGKARDVKALWEEARASLVSDDMPPVRLLTDLTGPAYTFVYEAQFENLAHYESTMATMFSNEDWQKWYQKFVPLVESSCREIYTIID